MLASRFSKFVDSLLNSCKLEVAFLANLSVQDYRTVMGKTLSSLLKELNSENITPKDIKKNLRYFPVPLEEEWRLPFLDDLLAVEAGQCSLHDDFSPDDIKSMISALCTT